MYLGKSEDGFTLNNHIILWLEIPRIKEGREINVTPSTECRKEKNSWVGFQ